MSAFTPTTKEEAQTKVHHSQYIRTGNMPDEAEAKPAEPGEPTQPEAE